MLASLSQWFASPSTLLFGGVTGLVFGFLLQKGGVTRFSVITGQFLLRDFTMLKIMLTAVVVGAVGVYGMRGLGLDVGLHVKSAALVGNAVGGLIFGAGMALLGYCPGTGIAALGDGSRHAGFGVLGMLVGSAAYAEVHPWVEAHVLGLGALGKETLATITGISPWWFIVALAIVVPLGLMWLERWERSRTRFS